VLALAVWISRGGGTILPRTALALPLPLPLASVAKAVGQGRNCGDGAGVFRAHSPICDAASSSASRDFGLAAYNAAAFLARATAIFAGREIWKSVNSSQFSSVCIQ